MQPTSRSFWKITSCRTESKALEKLKRIKSDRRKERESHVNFFPTLCRNDYEDIEVGIYKVSRGSSRY